ncbi:MAG TPA: hypothetical protein PKM20_07235 [Nitrosomonas sp.]|nr:hypothetical protein [Nitrosomonas sp.]
MKTSLTLLIVITFLPLLSACSTPSQILADAEVRRLCEKDGGITVYETVKLPVERFEKDGSIRIPARSLAKPDDEHYLIGSTSYLKKGHPELVRYHTQVFRRSDEKLLGEIINYSRRGGDIPGP